MSSDFVFAYYETYSHIFIVLHYGPLALVFKDGGVKHSGLDLSAWQAVMGASVFLFNGFLFIEMSCVVYDR